MSVTVRQAAFWRGHCAKISPEPCDSDADTVRIDSLNHATEGTSRPPPCLGKLPWNRLAGAYPAARPGFFRWLILGFGVMALR